MNLTSNYPFWSVRNGLLSSYPAMDRDQKCEVAIIGGGISGALVAHALSQAGISTLIVDKRDIGMGSTSGSTGLLQYEVDVSLKTLREKIGKAKAARSYQLCNEAVHKLGVLIKHLGIHCEWERRPSLFLARHKKETADFLEEAALRKKIGIQVDFWSGENVRRHYGFQRPAALFSPEAAQVDPHRLTHGLLRNLSGRGVNIFDRTEVLKIIPERRGVRLVTDGGFTIQARRVVMAAGFEATKYFSSPPGKLKSTYALISEPVSDLKSWHRRSLIWESGAPYLYLRTTAENRIIVGGEDDDFSSAKRRDASVTAKTRILLKKFSQLFPDIKFQLAYAWAGTFGETKDGLAYIGQHTALPHGYFVLGYGGNGITYSVIAGELIRDDLLGRKNPDAKIFAFDR